jgi:hypothetical protein
MRAQRGLTITGFILFSIMLFFAALLTFRLVPVFMEYLTIKQQFRSMVEDPAVRTGQRTAVVRAWEARAAIDDIRSLDGRDIEVVKQGDRVLISASYSVKVPLFSNVSACFDFEPSFRK